MVEYNKICEHCGSNFVAHRKDKRFCCSKCRDAHNKQKEESRIKSRERAKKWYQNNKEYATQQSIVYNKSHPEKRRQISKKYFDTHKESQLLQRAEYLKNQTVYEEYCDYAVCHFGDVDTVVDLEDLERIKTKFWCAIKDRYLCFKSHDLKYKLHRFIMQCDDATLNVHHIDNDQTNNRKSNLIVLTHSQHSQLHRYQDKLGRLLSRDEIIDFLSPINNN